MDELLAAGVSPLVGRETELKSLSRALEEGRLVTITGPGGVGKTRLAVAAVGADSDAATVALGAVFAADLLPAAVLAAVGARSEGGVDPVRTLSRVLDGPRRILLLDNCEQLRDAAAEFCARLLLAAPELVILATSRVALGVPGEVTFELAPLSLGPDGDAVRLFVDRAHRSSRAFGIDADRLALVERLCAELDGLPLAIELAAARTRMLDLGRIAHDLERRLDLLGGGLPAVPRHRSLRASIEWSVGLLREPERLLFERVGVFAGGWELEAAEAVCAGKLVARSQILDLLGALVDHSLVVLDRAEGVRFNLLSTVHAYAREKFAAGEDLERVSRAHSVWCAELVSRAHVWLTGRQQSRGLSVLDRESDNVRAALAWARAADPELGLRIAVAMSVYWHTRGRFEEGRHELEALVGEVDRVDDVLRVEALCALGSLLVASGDLARARLVVERAVGCADAVDRPELAARALVLLGELDLLSDPAAAGDPLRRAVALARQADDVWVLADALGKQGAAALYRSEVAEARPLLEESLAVARLAGDERSMHRALGGLARVAAIEGDADAALDLLRSSLELSRRLGDRGWIALDLAMLGEIERAAGRAAEGRVLAAEGLALAEEIGGGFARYMAIGILGRIALALGELDEAAVRFAAAAALSERYGLRPFTAWWHLGLADVALARADLDAAAASARMGLMAAQQLSNRRDAARATMILGLVALARGEPHVAIAHLNEGLVVHRELEDRPAVLRALEGLRQALFAAGQENRASRLGALLEEGAVDKAAALALRGRSTHGRSAGTGGWGGLSGAEAEVADLAASGASNPAIATALFMSRSTVKTHLSHVYAKLGVANRTELAALAPVREESVGRRSIE